MRASIRRGCAPNPRRPLAGTPAPRAAPAEAHRAGFHQTGLRPEPPASACGDPCAPRRARRGAPCELPSDGAAPRTPGVRLRGPLRPAPRPPRRTVRASIRRGCAPNPRRPLAGTPAPRAAPAEAHRAGFHQTGLRPEPPASACGDPCAPRRARRGAPCAPCGSPCAARGAGAACGSAPESRYTIPFGGDGCECRWTRDETRGRTAAALDPDGPGGGAARWPRGARDRTGAG